MNIHLAYYRNIWPFANEDILLHFPEGKYMIQSPVWTGKSFLFFDGIVYGLYKYSDRNIVNANCKEWDIYILFEVEENIYLLHRSITTTNSKTANSSKVSESTKSKLYEYVKADKPEYISNLDKKLPDQIVTKAKDFSDYINLSDWKTHDYKNESDLNNDLKNLLPLREVFVNRNIFLQDSEDIFQVQEAERLKIFKNIFSLLDIDSIKEELSGRAREIKWMILAKKNTDNHNQSFSKYISSLVKLNSEAKNFINLPELKSINTWVSENEVFLDKMTMDWLDINHLTIEKYIYDKIAEIKTNYQAVFTQKQVLASQISSNQSEIRNINSQIFDNKNQINILTTRIWELDPQKLENLKSQKNIYINQKSDLQNKYMYNEKVKTLGILDRSDLLKYINDQIQNGKDIKLELSTFQNSQQNLINTYQNLQLQKENLNNARIQKEKYIIETKKNNLQNQITNLEFQVKNIESNLNQKSEERKLLETELQTFQNTLNWQNKFFCKLIDSDCPFVDQINSLAISRTISNIQTNKAKTEQINIYISENEKQKNLLEQDILAIKKQIDEGKFEVSEVDKSEYISNLNKIDEQITKLDYENTSKNLETKISDINIQITQILQNLSQIDYKSIQDTDLEITNINKKIVWLEIDIDKLQTEIANIQNIQKQIDELQTSQNIHNLKISELENIYINLNAENKKLETELSQIDIKSVEQYEKILSEISTTIDKIKYIYEQFQNDIQTVKKLEEEEKIVKDLINVFGKELMLLILQESLPFLEDSINEFLQRIVNYEVRFVIRENGEKMEINIKDQNSIREVKSLSGGQKAILRLAWIFAIARRSHNKFLFLDETINNLDADNISAVAEMIKDFVLQNDIKFYSITHSTQIQSMAIWDQVINVKEQLQK